MMMAPVEAIKKLLKKTGWSLNEVDLIELNEAFAVQAVAITRELDLDPDKVNVNGGAVALCPMVAVCTPALKASRMPS